MVLTQKQIDSAKPKIKWFYMMDRLPTNGEVIDEVRNLERRKEKDIMLEIDFCLASKLEEGPHPIKV